LIGSRGKHQTDDIPSSILYKTKLPFILVFNKTDVQSHQFALDWMADFEEFQAALASDKGSRDSEGEPTFMNSLMNSMCLVLDEFYKNLTVGVFLVLFYHSSTYGSLRRLLECRALLVTALMDSWPLSRPRARNTKSMQPPFLSSWSADSRV